jgi:hypothetical protein
MFGADPEPEKGIGSYSIPYNHRYVPAPASPRSRKDIYDYIRKVTRVRMSKTIFQKTLNRMINAEDLETYPNEIQ